MYRLTNYTECIAPGLSGCVSPFAKTEGLWFNAKMEPENEEYELSKEKYTYIKNKHKGAKFVHFTYNTPEKYYKARMDNLRTINNYKCTIDEPDDGMMHVYIGDKPSIKL